LVAVGQNYQEIAVKASVAVGQNCQEIAVKAPTWSAVVSGY
jgi:hypothetical protein